MPDRKPKEKKRPRPSDSDEDGDTAPIIPPNPITRPRRPRTKDIFGRKVPKIYSPDYVDHVNEVSLKPDLDLKCPCGEEHCPHAYKQLNYTLENAGQVKICVSVPSSSLCASLTTEHPISTTPKIPKNS